MNLKERLRKEVQPEIEAAHLAETIQNSKIIYENREQRKRSAFSSFFLQQLQFFSFRALMLQSLVMVVMWVLLHIYTRGDVRFVVERRLPLVLCALAVCSSVSGFFYVSRSRRCRMMELEMSTLHSAGRLLLCRMLIVGGWSFLLLVLIAASSARGQVNFIHAVLYAAAPYLASWSGCLSLYKCKKIQATGFTYTVLGILLMFLLAFLGEFVPEAYSEMAMGVWAGICIMLGMAVYFQMHGIMKTNRYDEQIFSEI